MTLDLLLQLVATPLLCGLIWTVQLVHYPSFRFVAAEGFERFHTFHARRISYLVAVLMPVELIGAGLLVWHDPSALPFAGLALVFMIWASTAFLQMPAHRKLAAAFDETAHRRLVRTNWLRTVGWSARTVLLLTMLP